MDDLEHSGFASDDNQMEFGTLDSKIVSGLVKIIPQEFRRMVDLLNENSSKKSVQCLQADQLCTRSSHNSMSSKLSDDP